MRENNLIHLLLLKLRELSFEGRTISMPPNDKAIKLAGGYSGRILVFQGTDEGVKATFQHIIVGKGRVGYFLDMIGDVTTTAADKALFKRMYLTWRPR